MNVTLLENKATQLKHAVDLETQAKVCGCGCVGVCMCGCVHACMCGCVHAWVWVCTYVWVDVHAWVGIWAGADVSKEKRTA